MADASAFTFTCQSCRARLTLVGNADGLAYNESAWPGSGRGPLQASVFDHTNVDESFIVLDGKRQALTGTPTAPHQPSQGPFAPQQLGPGGPHPSLPAHLAHGGMGPGGLPRGLEESFVMLGTASVLRPPPGVPPHAVLPQGVSPLHVQAMLQQQQQQQQQAPSTLAHATGSPQPGQQQQQQVRPGHPGPAVQQQYRTGSPTSGPTPATTASSSATLTPAQSSASLAQQQQQQQGATGPGSPGPGGVVMAPADGSLGPGDPGGGQGGEQGPGGGGGGGGGSGLDAKLRAMAQLFEMASTNTQVDHPMCQDCVEQLMGEMEAQIAEAEREIAAYTACLAQLEGDGDGEGQGEEDGAEGQGKGCGAERRRRRAAEEEAEALEEMSRLEAQRDQERRRAEALEAELSSLTHELASLSSASADLAALEERYWHDANEFELLLAAHTDERGALLARIDRASQRLQLLKSTNVLHDAFKIWHDGPFGTISGFRLGRTPEVPVEWDEINAAWGQAVLLLHTMAQMSKLQFSGYRLQPMGSHPRIADKRATYDLFGPVNKLWSANYDRAMTAFVACLREFGEHARRKDLAEGRPKAFQFPFPIDGDKVNNFTVKLTLNKDSRWTKALKFMLANLKVAMQWCASQDGVRDAPPLQHLGQEGPSLQPEH